MQKCRAWLAKCGAKAGPTDKSTCHSVLTERELVQISAPIDDRWSPTIVSQRSIRTTRPAFQQPSKPLCGFEL